MSDKVGLEQDRKDLRAGLASAKKIARASGTQKPFAPLGLTRGCAAGTKRAAPEGAANNQSRGCALAQRDAPEGAFLPILQNTICVNPVLYKFAQ